MKNIITLVNCNNISETKKYLKQEIGQLTEYNLIDCATLVYNPVILETIRNGEFVPKCRNVLVDLLGINYYIQNYQKRNLLIIKIVDLFNSCRTTNLIFNCQFSKNKTEKTNSILNDISAEIIDRSDLILMNKPDETVVLKNKRGNCGIFEKNYTVELLEAYFTDSFPLNNPIAKKYNLNLQNISKYIETNSIPTTNPEELIKYLEYNKPILKEGDVCPKCKMVYSVRPTLDNCFC